MKIQFDPDLDYQREAVNSIVDIFHGQEVCQTNFTVAAVEGLSGQERALPGMAQNDLGVGNRLRLIKEELLENTRNIQLRNGLAPSEDLGSYDFTVEMETGDYDSKVRGGML